MERHKSPVPLVRLAKALGMTLPKLSHFVQYRRLPVSIQDGYVAIDRSYALQILKWTRSHGIMEVVNDLRVNFQTAKTFLNQGRLEGEMLFGKMRISLKSIENLKKEGVYDSDITFPDRRGFARFSEERLREIGQTGRTSEVKMNRVGHRWTSKEASKNNLRIWAERKKRKEKTEKEARGKSDDVVGLDEACRIMGMLGWEVIKLCLDGRLPGKRTEGGYRFQRHEIEACARVYDRPTAMHRR